VPTLLARTEVYVRTVSTVTAVRALGASPDRLVSNPSTIALLSLVEMEALVCLVLIPFLVHARTALLVHYVKLRSTTVPPILAYLVEHVPMELVPIIVDAPSGEREPIVRSQPVIVVVLQIRV